MRLDLPTRPTTRPLFDEAMSAIADRSREAFAFSVDPAGTVISVDGEPAGADVTAAELCHPDDGPRLLAAIAEVHLTDADDVELDVRMHPRDRGWMWFELVAQRSDAGVRLEARLAPRDLEPGDLRGPDPVGRAIAMAAGSIATEISSPLQGLADNLSFVEQSLVHHHDQPIREAVADARALTERLLRTTALLRETADRSAEVHPTRTDVGAVVRSALVLSRADLVLFRSIQLAIEPGISPVPVRVGDLTGVLSTLLSRAPELFRRSPHAEARLSASVVGLDDDVVISLEVASPLVDVEPTEVERLWTGTYDDPTERGAVVRTTIERRHGGVVRFEVVEDRARVRLVLPGFPGPVVDVTGGDAD